MPRDVHHVKPIVGTKLELAHVNRVIRDLNAALSRLDERVSATAATAVSKSDLDIEDTDEIVTTDTLGDEIKRVLDNQLGQLTSQVSGGGSGPGETTTAALAGALTSRVEDVSGDTAITEINNRLVEQEVTITAGGFGPDPTRFAKITILNEEVVETSRIIVALSGRQPTGKTADEVAEMDPMAFIAKPGSGFFDLYVFALQGPITGKFKVAYALGS